MEKENKINLTSTKKIVKTASNTNTKTQVKESSANSMIKESSTNTKMKESTTSTKMKVSSTNTKMKDSSNLNISGKTQTKNPVKTDAKSSNKFSLANSENLKSSNKNAKDKKVKTDQIKPNLKIEEQKHKKINENSIFDLQNILNMNSIISESVKLSRSLFKNESLLKILKDIPNVCSDNYKNLSRYLVSGLNEEIQKFAIIYLWVCENISYDVSNYFKGGDFDCSPEGVFKSKVGVCSGYSRLFSAMCGEVGLVSENVIGYAKGYGYILGSKFEKTNHEWNAIKLSNNYYLVDCCWGSGTVDTNKNFNKRLSPLYFMTPPTMFLIDHLPFEDKWQLVENKIELKQYQMNVNNYQLESFVRSYYEGIFDPLSYQYPHIICLGNNLSIKLKVPNSDILAKLKLHDKEISSMTYVMYDDDLDQYTINVLIPHKSDYQLDIFAKKLSDDKDSNFYSILTYFISCNSSECLEKTHGFPFVHNMRNNLVISPLKKFLKIGEEIDFKMKLKDTKEAAVVQDDKWIDLKLEDGVFVKNSIKITSKNIIIYGTNSDSKFWEKVKYEGI